ncbi:MAG: NAD(P)H-dependent oxidoreductase subunit E [Parasporobacterium sp.]|nr:NAD(P)H-dependent oxidoreductase subunit E [Parasporobacterium sp.]
MGENTGTSAADIRLAKVRDITRRHLEKGDSLIQILHAVQNSYGYLPLEVQKIVSEETRTPLATVSGVVSFYSFFSTEPNGKHNIRICLGTACYVRGGVRIADFMEDLLKCKAGHTTADGMFKFEIARCIGACGLAPAVSIDDKVYPNVSTEDLPGIIASYYKEEEEQG